MLIWILLCEPWFQERGPQLQTGQMGSWGGVGGWAKRIADAVCGAGARGLPNSPHIWKAYWGPRLHFPSRSAEDIPHRLNL